MNDERVRVLDSLGQGSLINLCVDISCKVFAVKNLSSGFLFVSNAVLALWVGITN